MHQPTPSQYASLAAILIVLGGMIGVAREIDVANAIENADGHSWNARELRRFELSLRTGACEGSCSIVDVTLRNGMLRVEPVSDSVMPAYQRRLERPDLARLANTLVAGGLFDTPSIYAFEGDGCTSSAYDAPRTSWDARLGDRFASLTLDYGCEGAPRKLVLLERQVFSVIREWAPSNDA